MADNASIPHCNPSRVGNRMLLLEMHTKLRWLPTPSILTSFRARMDTVDWIYTNGTYVSFLMNNIADLPGVPYSWFFCHLQLHCCLSLLTSSIHPVKLDSSLPFITFFLIYILPWMVLLHATTTTSRWRVNLLGDGAQAMKEHRFMGITEVAST